MSSLKYDIHVTTILHKALQALLQIKQWLTMDTSLIATAAERVEEAKILIELVEAHDCGSVGGFGRGQRENEGQLKYGEKFSEIFARWYFLMKKYSPTMESIEKKEVDEAKAYFKVIS